MAAPRVLTINSPNGNKQGLASISASTGATSAFALVSTNASGLVDPTFLALANPLNGSIVSIIEDFLGGTNNTTGSIGTNGWITIGSGTANQLSAPTWNNPGVQTLTTNTTANSYYGIYLGPGSNYAFGANANWQAKWIAYISSVSNIGFRVGLWQAGVAAKIPGSGFYFRYDTSLGDTTWMLVVTNNVNGTVEVSMSTGVVPVANQFVTFYISSIIPGTITFQIGTNGPVFTAGPAGTSMPASISVLDMCAATNVSPTTTTAVTAAYDLFTLLITGLVRS